MVVILLNLTSSELDSRLPLKIVGEKTTLQQNKSVLAAMSQQPDTSVVEANLPEVIPLRSRLSNIVQ